MKSLEDTLVRSFPKPQLKKKLRQEEATGHHHDVNVPVTREKSIFDVDSNEPRTVRSNN
jgi:hypothetical protein